MVADIVNEHGVLGDSFVVDLVTVLLLEVMVVSREVVPMTLTLWVLMVKPDGDVAGIGMLGVVGSKVHVSTSGISRGEVVKIISGIIDTPG